MVTLLINSELPINFNDPNHSLLELAAKSCLADRIAPLFLARAIMANVIPSETDCSTLLKYLVLNQELEGIALRECIQIVRETYPRSYWEIVRVPMDVAGIIGNSQAIDLLLRDIAFSKGGK